MAQLDKFKLSALSWDSDKDPAGFYLWIENMASLVRSTDHGPPLEDMLDSKLGRAKVQSTTVPSFLLNDPDFALDGITATMMNSTSVDAASVAVGDPDGLPPVPGSAAASSSVTSNSSGHFSLGMHSIRYIDLPDETQALDRMLYNVLRMNVKGSKGSLLSCVTFPSYVQAVCVLDKHMSISRMDRIMRLYDAWDKLTYTGNVMAFQTKFMALTREMENLKCDRKHYAMCKLMRAFDGKSKTIQFKIASDFNQMNIDDPKINMYDMVQSYCSELASVGDGKSGVNMTEEICAYCKKPGHAVSDCPKKKKADEKKAQQKKNETDQAEKETKGIICHHCREPGHKRPDCPKLKAEKEAAAAETVTQASSGVHQAAAVQSLGADDIQSLVAALRESSVQMVQVTGETAATSLPTQPNSAPGQKAADEKISLSLCDGMGCAAYIDTLINADITRYIGVEINGVARAVCDNLNPAHQSSFNGVDHSFASDVFKITEEKVKGLGPSAIKQMIIAAPCEDMSLLRTLPRTDGKPIGDNPRPGLSGKTGKVFLQCLQVLAWVLKYNPECEVFVEFVVFDDLPEDWATVCKTLGNPVVLDAADFSASRRVRAYWMLNMSLPDDFSAMTAGFGPIDANAFAQPGRTFEPYMVDGKKTIRTVGGSYEGNPQTPTARTSLPILLHDVSHQHMQHVRVQEAEPILGVPVDATAGGGVTPKDRLRCLGRGWDLRVTLMLLRFSKLARRKISGPQDLPCAAIDPADSLLVESSPEVVPDSVLLSLSNDDAQCLVNTLLSQSEKALSEVLVGRSLAVQSKLLALVPTAQVLYSGSVLDSGSSKHLSPATCVTQSDERTPLTGFNADGATVWTQGSGHLPLLFKDTESNATVALDMPDADKLDSVSCPILSMGKMLREGYQFYFESPTELTCVSPEAQFRFTVELGVDDILRMSHDMRTGSSTAPVPVLPSVQHVKRTLEALNAAALHDMLCHKSREKIYQTLLHTIGYKAVRLPDYFCTWCAKAKAHRKGLRHKPPATSAAQVNLNQEHHDYQDTDEDDASEPDDDDYEYVAPVAGRALGIQPVPRFDVDKLRPFEVMFADNKQYDVPVRGGRQQAFVLYDLKSTAKFKVDVFKKSSNGIAFSKIVAMNGIHKLPYACMVLTDGCGSMVHVEHAAVQRGINHQYIPPHEQSLNEAESICNFTWDDASVIMQQSGAPIELFPFAVDFALWVDMRTASTRSRGYLTPFEILRGSQPDISRLHRFYTMAFVCIPRSKRKQMAKKSFIGRAEEGRFLGFQSLYSSTYRVMLSGNRLVHNMNVTFDDANYAHGTVSGPADSPDALSFTMSPPSGASAEKASTGDDESGEAPAVDIADFGFQSVDIADFGFQLPTVAIEHCDLFGQAAQPEAPEYYDLSNSGEWLWTNEEPKPRPRPSYVFMMQVEQAVEKRADGADAFAVALRDFKAPINGEIDHETISQAGRFLAMIAQKNMKWKQALQGPDCSKAIAAFHVERDSLLDSILELLDPDHPEYGSALELAIPGRYLLDIRRNGMWKARGVKQGFREDKNTADGPGFVYYSHVAKLYSVRISFFRPNRSNRRIAIQDVKVAFLQSDKFPPDVVKYLKMLNPLSNQWEYYRQYGPLYGEYSGPVRWENTYAPYMESRGFSRGDNEKSVFYNEERDLLDITFVDDNYFDGDEADIVWGSEILSERFECKELEWLEPNGNYLDYLGMQLAQDAARVWISMEYYIDNCLEILNWNDLKVKPRPISKSVDMNAAALSNSDIAKFHSGLGMVSWLSNTARPDISYAHSRLGQHQASPNDSALEGLKEVFGYLKGTKHLQLSSMNTAASRQVDKEYIFMDNSNDDSYGWEFYCDSDFAGNQDPDNKRRSQTGYVALLNGAPVYWQSKVSSVCFASEMIDEAHADVSSTAAEIYAAGNATMDFLHLSYVSEEMGIQFPKPFILQMDNAAAKAFADDSCFKSKLKHIDTRQCWVKLLRDKNICKPTYVPSSDNLADIFTKILPTDVFLRLRSYLMYDPTASDQ